MSIERPKFSITVKKSVQLWNSAFSHKLCLVISVKNSEANFLILSFILRVQKKSYIRKDIAVTQSLLKVFVFRCLLKGKKKVQFLQASLVFLTVINIFFWPK